MSPEERGRSFVGKSVAARAAIVAAGPIANFLLAIVIFTVIFSIYGKQVTSPQVDSVVAGSAAETAGFKPGDMIVAIDGRPVATFNDLQRIVGISAGNELRITVGAWGREADARRRRRN